MLELLIMIFVVGILPFILLYLIGVLVNSITRDRSRR